MGLFPYTYRGDQESIVELIRDVVRDGKSVVIESGTGTGKTAVSLTGALEAVLGTGRKIIYLTRTKSQQKQIILEAGRISDNADILCVGLQGRSVSTCPMMAEDPELEHGTPEELSKLCSEYKKKDEGGHSCRFYANIESTDISEHIRFIKQEHPGPEVFSEYCLERELCPYELVKYALPLADIIAAPYPFVFMPHVLDHFLQWINVPISETVIIVDEAHNLPEYLREVMTCEYSMRALELAEREASEWDDPEIHPGMTVTGFAGIVRECFQEAVSEYLTGDDGILPADFIQVELMCRLGVSSVTLDSIYRGLANQGAMIAGVKRSRNKLPRSYIGSLGRFFSEWNQCDEETHIKLIIGGENARFQAYCLDSAIAAEPVRDCMSSIHMSGTLEPLAGYSAEIGLQDAIERSFKTPFPKENLKVLYVDDVSTKYEEINSIPETYERIKEYVIKLVGCVERNTAVFFPSYSLMERFINDGVPELLERPVYCERRGMSQADLMNEVSRFRGSRGSILFSVTGGRVSEGLDFPDKDLELAILIGIPYPKPTAKLDSFRRYCDFRFGNGWEHSSKIPAMRKMRQAIGRLIRSETDRGVAVILDRRVPSLECIDAELTSDPCGDVVRFFGNGQK